MAKKQEIPGFARKRKVLFGEKTTSQKLREAGEQFMDAGRYDDALEFFARCEAEDLARRVAQKAMEDGNAPLFMRAVRVLKEETSEKDWGRLAANAEKAGAYTMARVAYLKAGNGEEAARVTALVPGAIEPEAADDDEAEATPDEQGDTED